MSNPGQIELPPTQGAVRDTTELTRPAGAETFQRIDLSSLVQALVKFNASDLHLKVGRPPIYRIHGKLIPAKMPAIMTEAAESLLFGILSEKQKRDLLEKRQIDVSIPIPNVGRCRCNIYFQRGSISAAVRILPTQVPLPDELGTPPVLKELIQRPQGLVLITGATGTGKSTTLASLIRFLNETQALHILTIEDPIEFLFKDGKSSITQREVGSDTRSFSEGLVGGLRQDPDVIVIGEMRDTDTIKVAIAAAETGHLVISTLHTHDSKSSITRILDVFPENARAQVRVQLAASLLGVITQQLVPRKDGSGLILATEVLVKSPMIESLILTNELDKIPQAISNSNDYYHMSSMNQTLFKLIQSDVISVENGLKASPSPDDLTLILSGIDR